MSKKVKAEVEAKKKLVLRSCSAAVLQLTAKVKVEVKGANKISDLGLRI
ncbi:MAG: hypothetical protein ACFFCW_36845 [Candidatus Hodarchaeota archaeon]